jgi:hypothetical protein
MDCHENGSSDMAGTANRQNRGGAGEKPRDIPRDLEPCAGEPGTCADHARILLVVGATVVSRPARMSAALQRVFRAGAAHVVQQDGP